MRGMYCFSFWRPACYFGWSLCLLACGASQSGAPATQGTTPAAAAVQRPIPADPLQLIVGAPTSLVDMRSERLRDSALFARTRGLLERATCTAAADVDWLLASSQRALVASRKTDAGAEFLVLLTGTFSDADAERALALAVARSPMRAGFNAAEPKQIGRFGVSVRGDLAVTVLERRLLVVGVANWVLAAVQSIDHPSDSPSAAGLLRELAAAVHCDERSACLLAAADSFAADELERGLSELGAKKLGRALSSAPTALGISASDSLQLAFLAQLPSAEAAASVLEAIKSYFWQAGLLIRLAGLPDVLGAVQARTNDAQLALDSSVSAADLAEYEQRVLPLLDKAASACEPKTITTQ